ncbi:Os12g0611100, partial [Oryza sativa Japonica Group]
IVQGKLRNGQKVAIKVLSSESRQGTREFLNELSVISNINHHNLVKLHGCCVDGDQKMLVYNYLENNSLAQSLFGKEQKKKSVSTRFSNHGEFVIRFVLRTLNL